MMGRVITEELLEQYEAYMYEEEKRPSTIKKYLSDVRKLQGFAAGQDITKKRMIRFKTYFMEERGYKERSVNSFLVSANCFLQFMGRIYIKETGMEHLKQLEKMEMVFG